MPLQEGRVLTSDNKQLPVWIDIEKDQINLVGRLGESSLLIETQAALRGELDKEPLGAVSVLSTLSVNEDGTFADWPVLLDGQLDILRAARNAALAAAEPEAQDGTGTVPGTETDRLAEQEPETTQEEELDAYIGSLAAWFTANFDGYVYDYSDRDRYLPKLLTITAAGDRSNLQGAPLPAWTAVGLKLAGQDDGAALAGEYAGYFEVAQEYAYLYLSSEDFARAAKALEAHAPAAEVPAATQQEASGPVLSKDGAVTKLIAALKDDEQRAELFWRKGANSHIDDYDIDVEDRDAIGQFVGDELTGEQGWAMKPDFVIQATMSGGGFGPATDVTIDGGKLLVTGDGRQVWIELPDNAL